MAHTRQMIIGGVDTHTATHHAAVIDLNGRLLAHAQFPASPRGYAQLLAWMRRAGQLDKVGIEGTGAYGAGLARHLHDEGVTVLEVRRCQLGCVNGSLPLEAVRFRKAKDP